MVVDDPDQMLYVYSVEPGTPSADAMAAVVGLASQRSARRSRDPSEDLEKLPRALRRPRGGSGPWRPSS